MSRFALLVAELVHTQIYEIYIWKNIEGKLVGSMVTVGVTMFCTDWISKSDTKKMMKKGKQFARKMGLV